MKLRPAALANRYFLNTFSDAIQIIQRENLIYTVKKKIWEVKNTIQN